MMVKEVDITKQYRTKAECEVRLYDDNGGGIFPIHGAVLVRDKEWQITNWTKKGTMYTNQSSPYDLVEVKPRIKRTVWVNIYPSEKDAVYSHYKGKVDAYRDAFGGRIACVKVEIDCEEGEGL